MKNKIKIFLRIIAGISAFAMICGLLWFANGLLGNPISKSMVKRNAERYIAENYASEGYVIKEVVYDFKDVKYCVNVEVPNSLDRKFSLSYSQDGTLKYDSYDSDVAGGINTFRRLERQYRDLADTVLNSSNFPYYRRMNIGYGTLDKSFGVGEFEPDGIYNMQELGAKNGQLVLYICDTDISPERAAEVLLDVKKYMEMGGVPFATVQFSLMTPWKTDLPEFADYEDGSYNDVKSLYLQAFPYSEIYEEGLAERIREAASLEDSYGVKTDEISEFALEQK